MKNDSCRVTLDVKISPDLKEIAKSVKLSFTVKKNDAK